jgi:hypothetical protein
LKKTLSILMLIIFLFNVGGYYIVFWALRYQSNKNLETILDAGTYSNEGTVELKIPINIPYPLQPAEFERSNGEFELNGEYYQLVKQKLENDTLHVLLIKDTHEKKLVETMTDYANLSNDFGGKDHKALNLLGKLLKEYNPGSAISISEPTPSIELNAFFIQFSDTILTRTENIPSPPPKS